MTRQQHTGIEIQLLYLSDFSDKTGEDSVSKIIENRRKKEKQQGKKETVKVNIYFFRLSFALLNLICLQAYVFLF